MRGYGIISLDNPKTPENVGAVLRAAFCYSVAQVNISGSRDICWQKMMKHGSNTPRADRHIPIFRTNSPIDYVPSDCRVVAVDLIDGAKPLPDFSHPERAMYVFGPEDGTLGEDVTEKADHVVYIPTRHCMNLAASVNVLLYDRLAKGGRFDKAYSPPVRQSYNRSRAA